MSDICKSCGNPLEDSQIKIRKKFEDHYNHEVDWDEEYEGMCLDCAIGRAEYYYEVGMDYIENDYH